MIFNFRANSSRNKNPCSRLVYNNLLLFLYYNNRLWSVFPYKPEFGNIVCKIVAIFMRWNDNHFWKKLDPGHLSICFEPCGSLSPRAAGRISFHFHRIIFIMELVISVSISLFCQRIITLLTHIIVNFFWNFSLSIVNWSRNGLLFFSWKKQFFFEPNPKTKFKWILSYPKKSSTRKKYTTEVSRYPPIDHKRL